MVEAVAVEIKEKKTLDKVEIFIDGQTFFYLQREKLGWWIDPSKLLDWIESEMGEITQAAYFHRVNTDSVGMNKEEGFLRALPHIGFQTRLIPSRDYFSSKQDLGPMTNHILVELVNRMSLFDHAIIIGNDSGYLPAVKLLHANNKRYTVLGTPTFVDPDLLAFCGQNFIDLADEDIKERVLKDQRF